VGVSTARALLLPAPGSFELQKTLGALHASKWWNLEEAPHRLCGSRREVASNPVVAHGRGASVKLTRLVGR
jgi:hypothetical protein